MWAIVNKNNPHQMLAGRDHHGAIMTTKITVALTYCNQEEALNAYRIYSQEPGIAIKYLTIRKINDL